MKWITKPNEWYDNTVEESNRFFIMIGMLMVFFLVEWIVNIGNLAMFLLCLAGIYRISYGLIISCRKERI